MAIFAEVTENECIIKRHIRDPCQKTATALLQCSRNAEFGTGQRAGDALRLGSKGRYGLCVGGR